MTKFLIGAVIAAAAAVGSAGVAQASPTSPVHVPVNAGRGSVAVGVGFGGGGYYGGGYVQPVQSGYWTTQYRYVPTTVFVGYDQWQRPVYQTQYVQQAYQVWVPTVTYAPVVYRRPAVTFGVGFGYRWR